MTFFLNSPLASYLRGLLFFLTLAFCPLVAHDMNELWSQNDLIERIEKHQPKEYSFVKDKVILGYEITEEALEDLPIGIQESLGKIDKTPYTNEMLKNHKASYIALQLKDNEEYDFYVIDADYFKENYKIVLLSELVEKNDLQKLIDRLVQIPDLKKLIEEGSDKTKVLQKVSKVQMIKMSDIGFLNSSLVTIKTPWGTQTKPAHMDAYLAYDAIHGIYYMVNLDGKGEPINYAPVVE